MDQNQYKIIVAYDGTGYAGWIQQPDEPSIVQTLHDSFEHVFGKKIRLLGSSKTDAGVHAMGQVAVFKTDLTIPADKMKWAWNNALPESISIRSLELNNDFYPHAHVKRKTYHYDLFIDRPLPSYARYGHQPFGAVDWDMFQKALQLFEGTHNFAAFYTGNDREDTERTIDEIRLEYLKERRMYRVIVRGKSFLRHMVRRIIGASLAVAQRESVSLDDIQKALHTGQTNCQLPTAPAKGLMLYNIEYNT
jgi:tRNA pseudouridine38-40 synthase